METLTKDQKLAKQQDALREQKDQQKAGTQAMMSGNVDTAYKLPVAEKNYYHLRVVTKNLDSSQKNFNEIESVLKIHGNEFAKREKEGAFKQYDKVDILHDPTKQEISSSGADALTEAQKAEAAAAKAAKEKAEADADEAKAKIEKEKSDLAGKIEGPTVPETTQESAGQATAAPTTEAPTAAAKKGK